MPRKHTVRSFAPNTVYHIFNTCANDFAIFQDDEDFNQFQQYLSDYLLPPLEKDELKVTVEFQGKQLTGVPRQPNNYANLSKLYTYCLTPADFHLVLYQTEENTIAKFMQSLTTRFSMYFNKRHHRSGSPFRGKYKAIEIENPADLMLLSRYLHRKGWSDRSRSSYPDYLGHTQTPWVDKQFILEFFQGENLNAPDLLKNFTEDERVNDIDLGEMTLE